MLNKKVYVQLYGVLVRLTLCFNQTELAYVNK